MKNYKLKRRPKYRDRKHIGYCEGYYIRPTVNGKIFWKWLSNNKGEAERLAKEYSRQLFQQHAQGYAEDVDVGEAIDNYIEYKAGKLSTKKSRQRYTAPILKFKEYALQKGFQRVSEIQGAEIERHLNQKRVERTGNPLANKTWNVERQIIHNFFNFCLYRKWILSNPVTFKPKRSTQKEKKLIADEDIPLLERTLIDMSKKVPYYELIMALLYTGLRVGEGVRILKTDINIERRQIRIKPKDIRRSGHDGKYIENWSPKTAEARTAALPDEIFDIIKKQMKSPGEFLFPNTKGNMINERRVLEAIQRACQRAGIDVIDVHSLRHKYCTQCMRAGKPVSHIQKVMGHKTDSMTRRYDHMTAEAITKDFLNISFGKGKGE